MAKKTKSEDTTKQLAELNALRKQLDMAPTESTINLGARIVTLKERIAANGKAASPDAKSDKGGKTAKKKSNVDAADDKPAGTKAKTTDDVKDVVRLGDLCKKLKIEPRAARIKLRKAGDSVPATVGDSWRWATKDSAAIEAIIAPKGGGAE